MVKQRMSTSDVAAEASFLRQRVLGYRVANVYDLNAKTYQLKLAKSGEEGEKVHLVLESGTRFHTTKFVKDKSDTPSNFTLKLRKHLRTRRLEDVRQLGVDRVVDLTFGSGEAAHHLILELYSQGNVILTDSKYEILTLLRSHRDDAKGIAIMARHPYPIRTIRLRQPVTAEQLAEGLAAADDSLTLRGAVSAVVMHGPALCDHCILLAGLDGARKLKESPLTAEEQAALLAAVQTVERWLDQCETQVPEGFITIRHPGQKGGFVNGQAPTAPMPPLSAAAAEEDPELVYDDFDPLQLKQHEHKQAIKFDSFDAALDEFFAKVEGQKKAAQQQQQEKQVLSKLERTRNDQRGRAEALFKEAEQEANKAMLIEYNLDAVDGAINAVRAALAQGLDWRELSLMIKSECRAGNPVAQLIHSLQLEQNRITLLLSNFLDEEEGDDDALTRPATKVEVDLELNAYANARAHFEARKKHMVKQQKTVDANAKALKAAEKRTQQQLSKVKKVAAVQQVRKPYWFERFYWFISSENYLVVSGKDMQQNELLVKRYLRRGDIYVHAELHGASTTIIKNHQPDTPIPPLTISQAGTACVCRSQAWDAKIVTSAWWVHPDQVSKTAPTGEYLTTGSFMVRGRKNFLPPHPLIMGLGFLFKLDDSSLAGHVGERAPRGLDGDSSVADSGAPGDEIDVEVPEAASDDDAEQQDHQAVSTSADGNIVVQNGELRAHAESAEGSSRANSALEAFLDSAVDTLDMHGRASFQRYGLDFPVEAPASPVEQLTEDTAGTSEPSKPHLSAKQRRDMKKQLQGQVGAQPEPATGHQLEAAQQSADDAAALAAARQQERERREQKAAQQQQQQQAAAAAARGKHGKVKKMKDKYADQDEEDRQLALQLLASAGDKKDKRDRKEARKGRKEGKAAEGREALPHQAPATAEELAAAGAKPADAPSRHQLEREAARKQAEEAAEQLASAQLAAEDTGVDEDASGDEAEAPAATLSDLTERAEVAALLAEENIEVITEEQRERLMQLDALTGLPRAEDVLLHAMPVCGPYSALQSYKYKVKMTPGTQRKGKAARQAVEVLVRSAEGAAREKELLRAVPEMDVINCLVGSVKMSMPGISKLVGQAKKSKKAAAKSK